MATNKEKIVSGLFLAILLGVSSIVSAIFSPLIMVGVVLIVMFLTLTEICAIEYNANPHRIKKYGGIMLMQVAMILIGGGCLVLLLANNKFWLAISICAIAFVENIFAMIVGRCCYNRYPDTPRLAPIISPNKTWAGAIGGACICVAVFIIIGWYIPIPLFALFIYGVGIAVCAEGGDLVASLLKRKFGLKDSSDAIMQMAGSSWAKRFLQTLFIRPQGGWLDLTDSTWITCIFATFMLAIQ